MSVKISSISSSLLLDQHYPDISIIPTMLYTHATIITVDGNRRIINDGAIRVSGDVIADIGKTALLKERYPDDEEYDLTGRIVIPGLISTHMHTAQTLLRGTADDLELVSWLCERIWVLQGNFTEADGYAAARLSIGEMLKCGTTCFLESMVSTSHSTLGESFFLIRPVCRSLWL